LTLKGFAATTALAARTEIERKKRRGRKEA
jgi:hypothetical protein